MSMTEPQDLKKIFSALELPMNEDETIDYASLDRLLEYELSIGVEGFYCMGSSGEALLLSLEEREETLEHVLEMVDGRVPVIAHVGTIRTKDAIRLAKHAQKAGVSAVSMIPPYYYKFSMDEIIAYYETVMEAVPDLGMIVYNIPQFTGIEFNKDNAGRLLDNKQVIGVKHTSNNLFALERMKTAYPEKIFYNGFDEQFVAALAMGAEATIGTTVNVLAPLFLDVRKAFLAGDFSLALSVQRELNYCVEEMCKVGIFSAVKYLIEKQGIPCGSCRRPFHPLTADECARMDAMLEYLNHKQV